MEVNGVEKSKRISLDISTLFFQVVSILIQALLMICDEIFQALADEGDVLLSKPFLYPIHPPYSPDPAPLDFHVFGRLKKHL
jgi:hypothetical protein